MTDPAKIQVSVNVGDLRDMLAWLRRQPPAVRGAFPADLRARLRAATRNAAAEARWSAAVDWLINSRHCDEDALTAFWGIADGKYKRATDGQHSGEYVGRDGYPL